MSHRFAGILFVISFLLSSCSGPGPTSREMRTVSGELTTPVPDTAETVAVRFLETVVLDHDYARARPMLCADGLEYHEANTRTQIAFWSGEDVVVPPHDFRVVRRVELPRERTGAPHTVKVWVAFRYTYLYNGEAREIDMSDGWALYVTVLDGTYCVSPWAGG
ncbi:MAG TPA: hypothetical protein VER55_02615 [Ardenticatenaceae bacterium]|nr:hypothetical protein [Ardenticatenaceae bacterium]